MVPRKNKKIKNNQNQSQSNRRSRVRTNLRNPSKNSQNNHWHHFSYSANKKKQNWNKVYNWVDYQWPKYLKQWDRFGRIYLNKKKLHTLRKVNRTVKISKSNILITKSKERRNNVKINDDKCSIYIFVR